MAKTMTKSATLAHLAEKTSLSKKQIEGVLDETLALASREAKKSGQFVLPGFGKLVLANRKARIGRNPQTGEPIKIPAEARVQVPPRQEPEGHGAWEEVEPVAGPGAVGPRLRGPRRRPIPRTPVSHRRPLLLSRPRHCPASSTVSGTGLSPTPRGPGRCSTSPRLPGPSRSRSPGARSWRVPTASAWSAPSSPSDTAAR